MNTPPTMALDAYHREVDHHQANKPSGYHPATATQPRRLLTDDGQILAGAVNGHCLHDWNRRRGRVHLAVTGSGYAYGCAMAACNDSAELGEDTDGLVDAARVHPARRCRQPACAAHWPPYTGGGAAL